MKANEYKRTTLKTLDLGPAKSGLRLMARDRLSLSLTMAITGFAIGVGAVVESVQKYIAGFQINDEQRAAAEESLGTAVRNLTIAHKLLKLKMPSSTKKIALKGKGTPTELVLELSAIAKDLQGVNWLTLQGIGLGDVATVEHLTAEEFTLAQDRAKARAAKTGKPYAEPKDTRKINSAAKRATLKTVEDLFVEAQDRVYTLSWALLNKPISEVMAADQGRLNQLYPQGFFDKPVKADAPEAAAPAAAVPAKPAGKKAKAA